MIFKIPKDIKFSHFYKKLNFISIIFVIFSVLIIIFKGLNLGVDFKGGTLIEIRTENSSIDISHIRQSLLKMDLGDVSVKKFGKDNDYLVKIEMLQSKDSNFIESINNKLSSDLGSEINLRSIGDLQRQIQIFIVLIS